MKDGQEKTYECHKCGEKELNTKGVCEKCNFTLYWKNGLKIDTTLRNNLSGLINRVKNKKASTILVDGGVGEGKTTLGVICAKYISEELGETFDIKQQVRMGGKDFLSGMDFCVENKRHVIVYDEAGDFNTRASLTYFNQDMNRVFETYRALGIIVILCMPSFADLDASLMKKKIVRCLIHTYSRARTYGNYNVYSLWRMWYIKHAFTKVRVPDDAFKSTNANFFGHFKDLDPLDAKILENHSVKGKKEIIKKGMLKSKGLVTSQEIANKTGYSLVSVRAYLKRKGIKGEKHGRTLYFHKEIIESIIFQKENGNSISC